LRALASPCGRKHFKKVFGATLQRNEIQPLQARPTSKNVFHYDARRAFYEDGMKLLLTFCVLLPSLLSAPASAQESATFSCPAGKADIMKYFVMSKSKRDQYYLGGSTNSVYTQVFPNEDFAPQGYWFWLKSPKAHGFDVKVFDRDRIYMRATELIWTDNTTFKRFTGTCRFQNAACPKDSLAPRSGSPIHDLISILPARFTNRARWAPR
jgi:hypothetical protein